MQTLWMLCSWLWAPWQPYPMGSSSPHCLLSRKEWSIRSEIWSQIHSFCTRKLARYVSNFGTWLRLAWALEILLPSYCGYFLCLMMLPYQTFLKHGTLNECLWISKILDWFSLQWILSFVSFQNKRKWVCGFPWTTSIQARSTVWGAGAGSPPFAPPTSNPQSNHPFKQDNSVHSLCIIGTYLLESGQAILVPREALWASQLEASH